MALYRIKDFDPNYRDHLDDGDIKDLDLYSGDEKVGSVDDVLVDDEGRFRYLVVNTGTWIFGKKVLMPIGLSQIDYNKRRVYANGLTRSQVENLPEFREDMRIDDSYEERVGRVYRPSSASTGMTSTSASLDSSAPLDPATASYQTDRGSDRDADYTAAATNRYDRDPDLFNMNDRDHQTFKLYEERLVANKRRQKSGEVAIGKRVDVDTQHVSVPVDRERIVVERVSTGDTGRTVSPDEMNLQEGEVARFEVYEETADIRKEAFVREEVQVKKVVDHDTVERDEQIRREEIDVRPEGRPNIENPLK